MTEFEEAQELAESDSGFRRMLRRARDPISLVEMIADRYDLDLSIEEAGLLFDAVGV